MFNSSKLTKLAKKSDDIFSVFTKTQSELLEVNKEIDIETDNRNAQILVLQQEVVELSGIKTRNETLKNKIDTFLTT